MDLVGWNCWKSGGSECSCSAPQCSIAFRQDSAEPLLESTPPQDLLTWKFWVFIYHGAHAQFDKSFTGYQMVFSSSQAHATSNQPRQIHDDSAESSLTVLPAATLHAGTYEVSLEPADNPQELPLARRWLAVFCLSTASICVTCASYMVRIWYHYVKEKEHRADTGARPAEIQAAFPEEAISRQFHVSREVTILGISLFVLGLGLGPLVAGPISEIFGRRVVYRVSFGFFFVFMFPVAFAPNISKCLAHSSSAWSDNKFHFDSGLSDFSIPCRVLWGRISQHSWRKR